MKHRTPDTKEPSPRLHYKTIGNDDPKGLPKVFFSCYPEDFEIFFEKTWHWLSENHKIALFYEPIEDPMPWEKLRADLQSMQLIVIPVTTNLLLNGGRTIQKILPFAEEEHIPVLPIMTENGLVDLFSMIFGKIQYLSTCKTDPTAIPFKEKLNRFLDSILINEATLQNVRNAFAAYIFLSYRKKDRAYAQELMKLIHSHEQYRDFAIWYDEYLVPGEKYSDAIDSMLRNCDLFTLVVTPALLEKNNGIPNYVMRSEYPRAMEIGKPVLPVEMARTDKEALRENYSEIPECIYKDADEELEKAIVEKLHNLAMREDNPLHNFFIGLAYLDGIDVEVNKDRAVRLITDAAESGLEEAIRKLVTMYHDGKGVERNYQVSLEWQEKLVSKIKDQYKKSMDLTDCRLLIQELVNLGDAYAALGQLTSAESTYEDIRTKAEEIDRNCNTPETHRILTQSYMKLGEINHSLGVPIKAEQWYRKALETAEATVSETNAITDNRTLWMLYNKTGDAIFSQLGRHHDGAEMFAKGLEISKKMVEMDSSLDSRKCLMISYRKTGEFEKGIELCKYIAEETKSVEDRRALSVFYNNRGIMDERMRSGAKMEDCLKSALSIRKVLAEETKTVESYRDLAKIYENLGEMEKRFEQYEEAEKWYQAAVEIRDLLYRKIGSAKAGYELASSLVRSGKIGNRDSLLKAVEILKEQIRNNPEDLRFRRLGNQAYELLHSEGKREEARYHLSYQLDL